MIFPHLMRYLSPLDEKRNLHKPASSSTQKRVVYTLRLPSSDLDLLDREIVSIGCHRSGQQLDETSVLCRLKVLFDVLGSEKYFRSVSATGLVQIEVCR